jgi:CheY-like chemotaxis protein
MTGTHGSWNSRILLVDDDERIHGLITRILAIATPRVPLKDTPDGLPIEVFRVESALHGSQALNMVSAAQGNGQPYAAAFVDMEMPPGWDGIETIAHLSEADPSLQFAICTGHWDDQRAQRLARIDRRDEIKTILKPFDCGEFYQLACKLVRKWNLGLPEPNTLAPAGAAG